MAAARTVVVTLNLGVLDKEVRNDDIEHLMLEVFKRTPTVQLNDVEITDVTGPTEADVGGRGPVHHPR